MRWHESYSDGGLLQGENVSRVWVKHLATIKTIACDPELFDCPQRSFGRGKVQ